MFTSRKKSQSRSYVTKVLTLALSAFFVLVYFCSSLPKPILPKHRLSSPGGKTVVTNKTWTQAAFPKSNLYPQGPHPKARNVSIHFVNHHFGTSSELKAISRALSLKNNVKISLKETWGIFETVRSLNVPKKASNEYWPRAKEVECNSEKFDVIVAGDTMSLMRPHLQNCCPLKLIVSLTTRFDWAHDNDVEWKYLASNASRWSNVRVYPNNLIESWYAGWKGARIAMHAYLPSSGIPSSMWSEALQTINFKTTQPKDEELIVPSSIRSKECLTDHLDQLGITFTNFERSRYGGPLGLTDRIVVHFPYQSNTMSLFENLHQRVIYVLPTLRLFRQMGKSCEARMEMIPSTELTDEEFYSYVDWWRRDLQHLFFYFDDFSELQEGSSLRRQIAIEADAKRARISDFMVRQREYVLSQWEDILFEDWHINQVPENQCLAYKASNP